AFLEGGRDLTCSALSLDGGQIQLDPLRNAHVQERANRKIEGLWIHELRLFARRCGDDRADLLRIEGAAQRADAFRLLVTLNQAAKGSVPCLPDGELSGVGERLIAHRTPQFRPVSWYTKNRTQEEASWGANRPAPPLAMAYLAMYHHLPVLKWSGRF